MEPAQLTVALSNGNRVTGSLLAGAVQWQGRDFDARAIMALDDSTLFLFGPKQVDVAAPSSALKGFLELDVAGLGPTKLTLDEVRTIFRHPG
jgi:hypothetical protein